MIFRLRKSLLFIHMTDHDIENCITCSNSEMRSYHKGEIIFSQQGKPEKLFILIEGSISICHDTISGKHNLIAAITEPGDLFGEVFLFLGKPSYDNYAIAADNSKILQMPKDFLYNTCSHNCNYHTLLISNMLSILAEKAYYMSQRLQIMSSTSLRQKISRVLLKNAAADGNVTLTMNREELADFLNTARPSLSRELMKMQEEELIRINKKNIKIINFEKMQNNL